MSDTEPRNPTGIAQLLADSLLRSVAGTTALLRVAGSNPDTNMSELGLVTTTFSNVVLSPVVLRKLRPGWQQNDESRWELLISATSVSLQLSALDLSSAQALFSMTFAVTVGGQDYLIESVASNEALGQTYLYRLLLRVARKQAM